MHLERGFLRIGQLGRQGYAQIAYASCFDEQKKTEETIGIRADSEAGAGQKAPIGGYNVVSIGL